MKDYDKLIREDSIALLIIQVTQKPVDHISGRPLVGEEASILMADNLKGVLERGGVDISTARQELDKVEGPHKAEVLRALEILEERNKKEE